MAVAASVSGCTSAVSSGASGSVNETPASGVPLTEVAAKDALLVRFGDLSFCDPDTYPVAEGDQSTLATQHLAAMRGDTEAWTVITARLGIDPSSTPTGDPLVAAYREWKMLHALSLTTSGDGWGFDANFTGGPDASASPAVSHVVGTIARDGTIRVDTQEAGQPPRCPICLARGTLIATPSGEIAVEGLGAGDVVWTLDVHGRRVAAVVVRVGSTPVPADHQVIRLVLADGRAVLASPGHPLRDGRPDRRAARRRGLRRVGRGFIGADPVRRRANIRSAALGRDRHLLGEQDRAREHPPALTAARHGASAGSLPVGDPASRSASDHSHPAGDDVSDATAIAGLVAFPVNRWLITGGRGHAVIHSMHRGLHRGRLTPALTMVRMSRDQPALVHSVVIAGGESNV